MTTQERKSLPRGNVLTINAKIGSDLFPTRKRRDNVTEVRYLVCFVTNCVAER